ncbi:hypothetical protein [Marinobacter sp. CHS3-4]|uniref:hypothetical protein n=1 Tax=Marinobacter sp. CHS3-4 TaxID=3045174 RepID=UPI0024B5364C|nr:hypothetical protein [Marinobacter sp. CHS3-4]MDI9245861.1 hypothetical protein [Marinobacter sp. CHS3-4]
MREMMQKALSAMNARKAEKVSAKYRRPANTSAPATASEDWGMSPEEALKAGMVSGYK